MKTTALSNGLLLVLSFFCFINSKNCEKDNIDAALENKLLVAAIDLGTSYSGWAFSFKHEYEKDPTDVTIKQWYSGEHVSLKAPTTLLIKSDGKTLDSFGYGAETKYAELISENKHLDYYYFKRFKMKLHGRLDLSRQTKIEDENGRELPAMTVFALTIQYLRQDLHEHLLLRNSMLLESDIRWVLTVPAIWNDKAKQFMREAAIKAGIKDEDLIIALEPEAASLFVRHSKAERTENSDGKQYLTSFKPGVKYMVIDAGGGTVDITIHEILDNNHVRELHIPAGGPWGGTTVDAAFLNLLSSIVGDKVMRSFISDCAYDYLQLFRDFEVKKRTIAHDMAEKIIIRIPQCLDQTVVSKTGNTIGDNIAASDYNGKLKHVKDKLFISADICKTFFRKSIENIIKLIRGMMEKTSTEYIMLVGGLSESRILQNAIKHNFQNKKVYVSKDSGSVVLKGAVIFGYNPSIVSERLCRYTYGVKVLYPFVDGEHDQDKIIFSSEKRKYCNDVFDKLVEKDTAVRVNEAQGNVHIIPLEEDQDNMHLSIYACSTHSPKYTTDEGCIKIGEVVVNIKDKSVPREKRYIRVSFSFGGTEVKVEAKEIQTGEITLGHINLLDNLYSDIATDNTSTEE